MKTQMCRRFTITCRGQSYDDIELARQVAATKIEEGYLEGHDCDDTGAYHFTVTEDVPKGEWPA